MSIETTVNRHRGALLIAIGGFLVFLYIRHKRQQAAAAAAAQAAADAAQTDPGTMDQNTYNKQFSQPAPAYLGSPFSGYGANAPNYPPPTQLQPGPTSPAPPITFPNPAASSGDGTVAAATGGGAPGSQATGINPAALSDAIAGQTHAMSVLQSQAPIDPSGKPSTLGQEYYFYPGTVGAATGYDHPAIGSGLYTGAAGEPGTPTYMGIGYVPPAYR